MRARPRGAVLVVEDDPTLGEAMLEYLLDVGYAAVLVSTLFEARAHLAKHRADALILDLTLTAEFGGDLLAELASAPHAPPVVIASAFALAPIVAQKYGVTLVRKPFDLHMLDEAIDAARRDDRRPRTA